MQNSASNKTLLATLSIAALFFSNNSFASVKFHGTTETFDTIRKIVANKEKGVYLRFGDGDTNVATGSMEFDCYSYKVSQKLAQSLTKEMQEAFGLNGPTVLKTLPLYCKEFGGWEPGMFPGNHESPYSWCLDILTKGQMFWNAPVTDVYSHAALHFSSTQHPVICFDFLQFLKKSNCCLFVGNQNVPASIRNLLFGPQCIFIPTPAAGSFNELDRIERECLEKIPQNNDYKIIIIATGCAGRILQKRLWHKLDNVFLFDFGSLMDALCGWNSRAWIGLTGFNNQRFLQQLSQYLN